MSTSDSGDTTDATGATGLIDLTEGDATADERHAYDTAPVLFCTVDPSRFLVLKCNATLLHRLGRPAEHVLGRSLLDFVPVEERAPLTTCLRRIAEGQSSLDRDYHLGTDERYLVVRLDGRVERGPPGRLRLVFSDATQERRLEAQLVHAQRMDAIGRLAGGVAHDFNNLLSVITSCAAFLEEAVSGSAHEQDVRDIQHAARRGADLTQQLLAFSRQQVVKVETMDLDRMVERMQTTLQRVLQEHVTVHVHASAERCPVRVDEAKFEQVLLNLVLNAQDAMPDGGTLTIRTERVVLDEASCRRRHPLTPGPHAVLTVVDTGIGMDAEVQARIFEPFFTTKARGRGTGLGLSLCYGIVRQLGGAIWVESEVGRGSTFTVYLPMVEVPARPASGANEAPRGDGETVLLVEDDESVRRVTARILGLAGYEVVEARHGEEALDLVAAYRERIGIVVTDVVMPRLGGRELVARLREQWPELAVLFTSGYAEPDGGRDLALREHYLAKPFTPAQLRTAVHEALRSHRQPVLA